MQTCHPFDLLVRRGESEIRTAEAAMLFAIDHCRGLKLRPWLDRLDALARRVDRQGARTCCERIEALRTVLVDEEGFTGNVDDYYDPRNSFLHEVLDRRVGIPITLSVVWLDVCAQLNWPFVGVGLPGHYIIRCEEGKRHTHIDPFGGGRILDRRECEGIVARLHGRCGALFHASSKSATLSRMLNNLRAIYIRRQAWYNASCVLRRMLALHPDSDELQQELRAVEGCLAQMN